MPQLNVHISLLVLVKDAPLLKFRKAIADPRRLGHKASILGVPRATDVDTSIEQYTSLHLQLRPHFPFNQWLLC